jgi:ribonuclease J
MPIDKIRQIVTGGNNKQVKIQVIGGTSNVNGNLFVYECGDTMIAFDCGIAFPSSKMLGVDVIIPDFNYLIENKDKFKALFITHAHYDHFGAVPYLFQELQVPIYTSEIVKEFVMHALEDKASKQIADAAEINLLTPDTPEVRIGDFTISAFGINHSVPDAMGFAIKTPQGTILHAADFKLDWTPVLDKPIDIGTIADHGEEGVLCLLSDCLGVTHEGYVHSESTLNSTFDQMFEDAKGRQVLVTTISSNISRMYQIINSAVKYDRKLVVIGRSIQNGVEIARKLGYLDFDDSVFITDRQAREYESSELLYLVAGCYGQWNSSLARVGRGEHRNLAVEENGLVIFSADPAPPSTKEDVASLIDDLTVLGAEVIYTEIQNNLHVSGHGLRGDLITMAALAKPEYFMPIGGSPSRMRAYTNMISELGVEKERVFELLDGDSIVFESGVASPGPSIEVKPVPIEGRNDEEVSPVVLKDREVLSNDGLVVVVVPIIESEGVYGSKVDIITRGFVYAKEAGELVGEVKSIANSLVAQNKTNTREWGKLKADIEKKVFKYLKKQTGRYPMVLVHGVKV